jgi:chemotaxis protein MotB
LPRRRIHERDNDDPEQGQQWQTIYCSLMLLLTVFFVMIAAWSTVESRKMAYARNIADAPKIDEKEAAELMRKYSELPEMKGVVTLEALKGGFKAVVETPVLFESGKAGVNRQAHPMLDDIARIAADSRLFITIEGHTDNTPINTAEFPSNWELSTMRAINVLRYIQRQGVPADRLTAVGYAEQRPVMGNETEAGRQKNRRIEIIFSKETL